MKKNHGKRSLTLLALMLVFLCACTPQEPAAPSAPSTPPQESSSQQEPEKEKTSVDSIMDSYYLDDHPEVVDTFQTGLTVGRLIPRYSTDSTSKETMLELCKKLQAGEKLEGLLRFEKEYYALVFMIAAKPLPAAWIFPTGISPSRDKAILRRKRVPSSARISVPQRCWKRRLQKGR